ncbi:unnamed protein product [Penicillium glandicola]
MKIASSIRPELAMLVSYSVNDLRPESDAWYHEEILELGHHRAQAYNWTAIKKWVDKYNAHPSAKFPRVYRHFIPRKKIITAIRTMIQTNSMTRCQALQFLIGVTSSLNIQPDPKLQDIAWDANRAAYDTWLTWAVESMADWEQNIFLGYGTGDQSGEALDLPCTVSGYSDGRKAASKQLNTCLKASLQLLCVLPSLSEWFWNQFNAHYSNEVDEWSYGAPWSESDFNLPPRTWTELVLHGKDIQEKTRPNEYPRPRYGEGGSGSLLDWYGEDDSDYDPREDEEDMEEESD